MHRVNVYTYYTAVPAEKATHSSLVNINTPVTLLLRARTAKLERVEPIPFGGGLPTSGRSVRSLENP